MSRDAPDDPLLDALHEALSSRASVGGETVVLMVSDATTGAVRLETHAASAVVLLDAREAMLRPHPAALVDSVATTVTKPRTSLKPPLSRADLMHRQRRHGRRFAP